MTELEWRYEFAFRLRKRMKQKGLNQKQLAELSGVEEHSISRYITRQRKPSADIVRRLARTLDCTTDYLTNFDEEDMISKKYMNF